MQSIMLKAKLHGATITNSELNYDGSVAIDEALLEVAGMVEFEQIDLYNVTNGERWTTYVLKAEANSGIVSVNGAGARLCQVGDNVIMCTYGVTEYPIGMAEKPTLVYLDGKNKVNKCTHTIDKQMSV